MLKRIHVNQHIAKANKKNGTNEPAITVKTYKENIKCNRVKFFGKNELVQSSVPLACGATIFITTLNPIEVMFNDGKWRIIQ